MAKYSFIVEQILKRLEELDMTPHELCSKAGINVNTFYISKTRKKPFVGFETEMKFCRVLGVKPEYFLEESIQIEYPENKIVTDLISDNEKLKKENAEYRKKYLEIKNILDQVNRI